MITYDQLYIGGRWERPASGETIEVVSPFTEKVVGRAPSGSDADIDQAVGAARAAFEEGSWRRADVADRIAPLARLAEMYAARLGDMAELITLEMGAPISLSNALQAPMPLGILQYFLGLAASYPFEERRTGNLSDIVVRREPVGVVAAIIPWNVPQAVAMQKVAPALLAGCSVVLKPAPETPLDALLLAELAAEAGLPEGLLSVVPGDRATSEHLVVHPDVDKVTFTGSTAAGRRVAQLCGQALKHCSLELGGKSAAIVLEDADLEATIEALRFASFLNSGQACVSHTRLLVSADRHDEFVELLCNFAGSLQVGDPFDPATEVGPLVAERQRDRVEHYIRIGEQEGAKVALGGARPAGLDTGWFVAPTIFTGVDNRMTIAQEEIFGPVLAVIPFTSEAEAIDIANDSDYGLAGSVFTADVDRGLEVAREVRTGTFGVNHYTMEFGAPYGGVKASGLGREMGPEGFHAFLDDRTIYLPRAPSA